jgi:hypothetical protein
MALQDYEQVGYRSSGLSQHTAYAQEVISGQGATRTLTTRESGALCLFDRAAGIVYTLPPPVVGMTFEFLVTTTVTSNAAKVITDAGTTFIVGGISAQHQTPGSQDQFTADGTTIRAISTNGSTTGGIQGESYTLTAISSTQWGIRGQTVTSGTAATPFATS